MARPVLQETLRLGVPRRWPGGSPTRRSKTSRSCTHLASALAVPADCGACVRDTDYAADVGSSEVRTVEVRPSEIGASKARSSKCRTAQIRTGQVRALQLRSS